MGHARDGYADMSRDAARKQHSATEYTLYVELLPAILPAFAYLSAHVISIIAIARAWVPTCVQM